MNIQGGDLHGGSTELKGISIVNNWLKCHNLHNGDLIPILRKQRVKSELKTDMMTVFTCPGVLHSHVHVVIK